MNERQNNEGRLFVFAAHLLFWSKNECNFSFCVYCTSLQTPLWFNNMPNSQTILSWNNTSTFKSCQQINMSFSCILSYWLFIVSHYGKASLDKLKIQYACWGLHLDRSGAFLHSTIFFIFSVQVCIINLSKVTSSKFFFLCFLHSVLLYTITLAFTESCPRVLCRLERAPGEPVRSVTPWIHESLTCIALSCSLMLHSSIVSCAQTVGHLDIFFYMSCEYLGPTQ